MKKFKNNLIIIPFNLPWEWSTDYTNQTAFILGKNNTVICYMWGESYSIKECLQRRKFPKFIKKYSKKIYLFYPILWIPFRRYLSIMELNEKINLFVLKIFVTILSLTKNHKVKYLWVFDPVLEPWANNFKKNWKIIYDCVDFFTANPNSPGQNKKIVALEKKIVNKAHLVTGNSTVLVKHLKNYGRKNIPLVPQGFRVESFESFTKKVTQIKRDNKPLIGFLGAVNHRLDYSLFYKLAKRNPQWGFAIWGPFMQKEDFSKNKLENYFKLIKLPNVITGKSDKKEVPGIISQFDVGIIPYDPNLAFNKYCHPMKIFEYFYLGKPVISTEILELNRFPNLVHISNNTSDWEKYIKKLLAKPWPEKYKKEQKKLAIENSWENKITAIISHVRA